MYYCKPKQTNRSKTMNKLKTNPQNQYKGLTEQEINEALKDFAAYIVLMLTTVLGLMLIVSIN